MRPLVVRSKNPLHTHKKEVLYQNEVLGQTVALRVVEQAIGVKWDGSPLPDPHAGKNPAAVALGKLGGAKGGAARAAALSPRKRKMIAKKAAEARWKR